MIIVRRDTNVVDTMIENEIEIGMIEEIDRDPENEEAERETETGIDEIRDIRPRHRDEMRITAVEITIVVVFHEVVVIRIIDKIREIIIINEVVFRDEEEMIIGVVDFSNSREMITVDVVAVEISLVIEARITIIREVMPEDFDRILIINNEIIGNLMSSRIILNIKAIIIVDLCRIIILINKTIDKDSDLDLNKINNVLNLFSKLLRPFNNHSPFNKLNRKTLSTPTQPVSLNRILSTPGSLSALLHSIPKPHQPHQ